MRSGQYAKRFVAGRRVLGAVALSAALSVGGNALAEDTTTDNWLPSLITDTPQEGFELAVKLSQKGVAATQTDPSVRKGLRSKYAHDPDSLIAVTGVIATHFQTVAAANDYWRNE